MRKLIKNLFLIIFLAAFLSAQTQTTIQNSKINYQEKSPKKLELYFWEDQKIVPIECIEKCKNSEFSYKILSKNDSYILPIECKKICFSSQKEELQTLRQTENKVLEKVEKINNSALQQTQEKNQLKNEVKEEFRQEIQQVIRDKKENQQIQKNEIGEIAQQKNEELKEIQNRFKEEVRERALIKIKNITKELEINKEKNEINFTYKNFKVNLKNATLENNTIKVNNKTILLPEEFNLDEQQIKEMKIIQNQNKVIYKIKTQNSGKLFGIFRVEYEEEKEIDATSNTQNVLSSPWWKIFVFK
ncbi:MAG: hypothetical protein QXV83_02830 [Candidatus Anstonellaceae archaeon]